MTQILTPELLDRARATLRGTSRSYVNDACAFAQALLSLSSGSMVLDGWTCACGSFNGAGHEWRSLCRSCDAPGPEAPQS